MSIEIARDEIDQLLSNLQNALIFAGSLQRELENVLEAHDEFAEEDDSDRLFDVEDALWDSRSIENDIDSLLSDVQELSETISNSLE